MSKAVNTYTAMAAHGALEDASPHRITQLLYQAVFDAMSTARRAMDRGDTPAKGAQLSYAIELLGALMDGVNPEAGELADQLTSLYRYLTRRLVLANLHNDREALNECEDLLTPIARAWDRLGERDAEAAASVDVAPKARPEPLPQAPVYSAPKRPTGAVRPA
jgi:flagellar protein FliS